MQYAQQIGKVLVHYKNNFLEMINLVCSLHTYIILCIRCNLNYILYNSIITNTK